MKTRLERIQKDIESLSKFNATPGNGLTRFSLTDADRGAREYLRKELTALGLKVYEDAAGSLFGRREGSDPKLPVIMVGSHFDSVKNGGNFDGPAGVIMALEIMRTLNDNKVKTRYPVEFIAMIEEEGGRFGAGVFGSRAMAGLVNYKKLEDAKDAQGVSMADAFRAFGFKPEDIEKAKRDPATVKAFLELHIEQGPVLETKGIDVGIVEFIVGITQIKVTVKGRPDHAGTTPMHMRHDALGAAAKVISEIHTYPVKENNGSVATVGVMNLLPGAANIIPGEVTFTVDIRSKDAQSIKRIKASIEGHLQAIAAERGLTCTVQDLLSVNPVPMAEHINALFRKNVAKLGFTHETMLSGAGHDAMIMGQVCDVGLIFVPSKDGRSHCPEEWTDYDDLQKGIELIYETIVNLAEEA
jgi:allantoate deiminase